VELPMEELVVVGVFDSFLAISGAVLWDTLQ
jgi:hypothetical protein